MGRRLNRGELRFWVPTPSAHSTDLVHEVLKGAVLDEDDVIVQLDVHGVRVRQDLIKGAAVGFGTKWHISDDARVPDVPKGA